MKTNAMYDFQFSERQLWNSDDTTASDLIIELPLTFWQELLEKPNAAQKTEDKHSANFHAKVAKLKDELEQGRGVVRVHCPELALASMNENFDKAGAFQQFMKLFGHPLSQSQSGETLLSVKNHGYTRGDPRFRGPFSSIATSFHTDRCDIIGFYCVRQAPNGGANRIANTRAIHEHLRREAPDLLEMLYQPFLYKRHSVDKGNSWPYCEQPIFANVSGHFVSYLMRVLINRAYNDERTPELTQKQKQALDSIEELARGPKYHLEFLQQSGDILLVNNFVCLHARDSFEDSEQQRRELLRVWISSPNSRPLPESFVAQFGSVGAGEIRGGIHPAQ